MGCPADPDGSAQRAGEEPEARGHRSGERLERATRHHPAAGDSRGRGARHYQVPERSEAEKGAGEHPG